MTPVRIKQPESNWIACAVCLNQRSQRVPAETLIHGYAVCAQHVDLVTQPEFDIYTLTGSKQKRTV